MGWYLFRRETIACILFVAFAVSRSVAALSNTIEVPDNSAVRYYLLLYAGSQRSTIEESWERLQFYYNHITREIERLGLPPELVYLPIVESNYDANAISKSGASGLWQLMANTASYFGLRMDGWIDERRDFWIATDASLRKLKENYLWFKDWHLALAAYNCGLGRLERIVRQYNIRDFWDLRQKRLLPAETAEYVPKFLATAKLLSSPQQYGLELTESQPIHWRRIQLRKSIDLKELALISRIPLDLLEIGNAGLIRGVTPPGPDGYWLKLPESKWHDGIQTLQKLDAERLEHQVHTVRTGDTFYSLAAHYETGLDELMDLNLGVEPRNLRPGTTLLIPLADGVPKKPPRYLRSPHVSFTATYTIRRGDTLWAISRRHGITSEELAQENGIVLSALLKPGQVLRVPSTQVTRAE